MSYRGIQTLVLKEISGLYFWGQSILSRSLAPQASKAQLGWSWGGGVSDNFLFGLAPSVTKKAFFLTC